MTQKHLLIIYTGGTIGMQPSEQGFQPGKGFENQVAHALKQTPLRNLPHYTFLELDKLIDSSGIQPSDWQSLADLLRQHWADYDGFIILHGTDTMAYTASALSFMLQGQDKAVILTGSQIPLQSERSDGLNNLLISMQFAASDELNEVCIFFHDRLLRGNRSSKVSSTALAAFDSPNHPELGLAGIDLQLNQAYLQRGRKPSFCIPALNSNSVSLVHLFPGISAHAVQSMAQGVQAMILLTYGAGNLPDSNPDLIAVLHELSKAGLIIINVSQCLHGSVKQGAYAAGSALDRIGAISGQDMTLEAAFTKLHILLAQGYDKQQVKSLFQQNLCGEMTSTVK
ncbi:asparaginase [Oceanospirillum sp. HFRX-1_2]